ncbi:MAG: integrase arm-type DNA-binding domain-containing protein [Burkholderiaceae bacterium]|nr:integrase arm-type DNA-binding domain-containing protein [Burkholderiaceae bacterium]
MPLTDIAIRQFKHSGKPSGDKHSDGGGLYLHVTGAGKYWRMAYRFAGKQKKLALGVYPAVTLTKARKRRDEARELLADGQDPGVAKRQAKIARAVAAANTFEAVAREFHGAKADGWSASYAEKWIRLMEKDLFPYLGKLPLTQITAPMLLEALRRVERRGVIDIAHTLRRSAGQVFRYGIQTGRCERDPAIDLRGALKPLVVKHMAAILEPARLGDLMRAIPGYNGFNTTKAALKLSALLLLRPGNIRAMEWAWVDLDKAMLTIPAESMKRRLPQKINGRPHFVPLAPQAVAILKDLQPLTGNGRYVFPSTRTVSQPMSENTVNAALSGMGFGKREGEGASEQVAHGFRSTAETMMLERLGIPKDVVEAQLAHGKSGPLGSAYDRAEYMDQRRKMMCEWADYLDRLRLGAEVIPFPAGKKAA